MKVAVAQPLPGIGDMIWHLPHIRAIAAHLGHPVTLIAKPRSLADQIWRDDPAVQDILWVDQNPAGRRGEHDGPRGFLRLTASLRAASFDRIVLLHHSQRIAAAAALAGIEDRTGYGWGAQRWFLSHGPYLPKDTARLHQHTRATRFLQAAGIPLPSAEPRLDIPPDDIAGIARDLPDLPRPFVTMGIGASEPSRQFGASRLGQLAAALLEAGWPAVVLVGGPGDQDLADAVTAAMGVHPATAAMGGHAATAAMGVHAATAAMGVHPATAAMGGHAARVHRALGWHLRRAAALLSQSAFYVGNNTGVMNMAAATGVRTYALFGTTPPFFHAAQIVPVVSPPGGPDDGMARLSVPQVLAAIGADRGTLGPGQVSSRA